MALYLGANDFEIGALAAAPFLMQGAQLLSPYIFRQAAASRGRITLTLAISRLLWISAIPLLLLDGSWRLPVLIGVVLASGFLAMISSPGWLSWMADIVPERFRGRFFSRRNVALAATTLAGTILASLVLDWTRSRGTEGVGFAIIIFIAAVGSLLAWRAMSKIPDTAGSRGTPDQARPDLLAPFRNRVFRQVLTVFGMWNIGIGLSAAFFAPHMLSNLNMSFFQIGLYSCGTALAGIVSSRLWGSLIDRYGSKAVLNICAFGISFIPVIWLLPDEHTVWILIPEAAYSGLLWAGFNLAAFTLPLDHSPRTDRTVYLSVFATATGLAFFTASILAGMMAEWLSGWSSSWGGLALVNYHILFLGSTVVRLATAGLIAAYHEPSEIRLPVVIQLMGYAVLKRMSIGRQLFPFAAEAEGQNEANDEIKKTITHKPQAF
jgi:MFS family permease